MNKIFGSHFSNFNCFEKSDFSVDKKKAVITLIAISIIAILIAARYCFSLSRKKLALKEIKPENPVQSKIEQPPSSTTSESNVNGAEQIRVASSSKNATLKTKEGRTLRNTVKAVTSLKSLCISTIAQSPKSAFQQIKHPFAIPFNEANALIKEILNSRDWEPSDLKNFFGVTELKLDQFLLSKQQQAFLLNQYCDTLEILENERSSPLYFNLLKQDIIFKKLKHFKISSAWLKQLGPLLPKEAKGTVVLTDCSTITALSHFAENITGLRIEDKKLTHEHFQAISASFPMLEFIWIKDCQSITSFEGCFFPVLRELDVGGTSITNSELQAISKQCGKTLEVLNIRGCTSITSFEDCSFPGLRKLNVGWTSITNLEVQAISKQCEKTLEVLDIDSCEIITNFEGCSFSALRKLNVGWTSITNLEVQAISKQCGKTLEVLNIGGCTSITSFEGCFFPILRELDVGWTSINSELQAISKQCGKTLEVLNISNCESITSFEGCFFPVLRELDVGGTSITNSELQAISKQCEKTLEVLNIGGCTSITSFEGCSFSALIKLDK